MPAAPSEVCARAESNNPGNTPSVSEATLPQCLPSVPQHGPADGALGTALAHGSTHRVESEGKNAAFEVARAVR